MGIFTFNDLLELFPNRHLDKTKVSPISEITPQTEFIQIAGKLISADMVGENRSRRLVANLKDSSGIIELVWFQGAGWIQKMLQLGNEYLVYGRTSFFQGSPQISHPEIEIFSREKIEGKSFLRTGLSKHRKIKSKRPGRKTDRKAYVYIVQHVAGNRYTGKFTGRSCNAIEIDATAYRLPATSFSIHAGKV